ncbi:MAG: SHOCT domain-containing protein [Chloroflexales bacterium]|nr:SHOCT domain-containing protein [Chloroflexales bacterium]
MMHGTSMLAGMGWPGVLLMLLLWGGAIALILWGTSGLFPTRQVHIETEALEILGQRYARGEISREEFLQASEALRPSESEPPTHAHQHPGGHGR